VSSSMYVSMRGHYDCKTCRNGKLVNSAGPNEKPGNSHRKRSYLAVESWRGNDVQQTSGCTGDCSSFSFSGGRNSNGNSREVSPLLRRPRLFSPMTKALSTESDCGWQYREIIAMELCPAMRANVKTSTPASANRVRAVCRKQYGSNGVTSEIFKARRCCFLPLPCTMCPDFVWAGNIQPSIGRFCSSSRR
jgi:hypothetical protein